MKRMLENLNNSPGMKPIPAVAERDQLRSEVANLKSQLAQKDAAISSLNSQARDASSWKGYYNSAQSQVSGLSSSLSQSQSELNSLKAEKNRQDRENKDLLSEIDELKRFKPEAETLKKQLEDNQAQLTKVLTLHEQKEKEQLKNYEAISLKLEAETVAKKELLSKIEHYKDSSSSLLKEKEALEIKALDLSAREAKLSEEITAKQLKLDLVEKKFFEAEAKVDFMTKFFDEVKQEKLELKQEKQELKQELKSYKKSLVKKHDLSVNQSIEIEKLRQEVLEMSQSQFSISHSDKEEDLSPLLVRSPQKSFTLPGTRTTVSQLVDTQELMQYMKAKKGYGESMLSSMLEPLHFDAENISLDTNSRLVGENFTVIDKDVS